MEMDAKNYIGKAIYDEYGGSLIWGNPKNDELVHLLDVGGWGAIQNMFPTQEEAMKFQDKIGEFIVDAINEKIERNE